MPGDGGDVAPVGWVRDLPEALADFSRCPAQAANRMDPIQRVVKAQLQQLVRPLGPLGEVRLEQTIPGKHRAKTWDLAFFYARRPQLAISTKSILKNVSGTVPNRIDDAMGECVNVHAHDPGMVLGYLFVMDARSAGEATRTGRKWLDVFAEALASFSGRRSEQDAHELFEAATLLVVSFDATPPAIQFHPRLLSWVEFFDVLVRHVRARHPVINLGLQAQP